jgi:hypothetical protein
VPFPRDSSAAKLEGNRANFDISLPATTNLNAIEVSSKVSTMFIRSAKSPAGSANAENLQSHFGAQSARFCLHQQTGKGTSKAGISQLEDVQGVQTATCKNGENRPEKSRTQQREHDHHTDDVVKVE